MTLADNLPPSTRVTTDDLARLPAAELLAILLREGATPPPNLAPGEMVAALVGHRLLQGREVCGEGVLELLPEGFGFLRSPHFDYEASPHDPFVTPSQVRGLNLKTGHRLVGPLRAPRGNERFFALTHVDTVNGADPAKLMAHIAFAARTPIVGQRPLSLGGDDPTLRALAQLAPWCRGQRCLLQVPASFRSLHFLAELAVALRAGDRDLLLSLCALAQRPEDLATVRTRFRDDPRTLVTGSTFAQTPARQVAVAELTLQRAQRDVEAGHDVVLLFHSLTALAHAVQREQPASGRWLCPGLDVQAVLPGKRLFAAARQCSEGGSLTVLATATIDTTALADGAVLAEFRHCGNSQVVVDPSLADAGVPFPFDLAATRTRPEDDGRSPQDRHAMDQLRRELSAMPAAARGAHLAKPR